MASPYPLISVIVPVKNAVGYLGKLLDGLERLDYPADRLEVLFVDGRSSDATREMIAARARGWAVIDNPRQTVAPARNIGFERARGELIALTDGDCVPEPDWLKTAVAWFQREAPVVLPGAKGGASIEPVRIACVGGPNRTPPDETPFGRAVGFVFGQALFAAGSVHARNLPAARLALSIPGCNAIYRREALEQVMPVDETLLTCDDTELNRRLRDKGWALLYTPGVIVQHYRRPTPGGLLRQMIRYGIGRVQFGRRGRGNLNWTHRLTGFALPLVAAAWLVCGLALGAWGWLAWPLLLTLAHLSVGVWALAATRDTAASLRAPVAVLAIWTGWSAGYLRERLWPIAGVAGK